MINAPVPFPAPTWARGALAWALGFGLMLWLDGQLDLANLALLLVLTSAVAALWLPTALAVASATLGVLAFNWQFVPPRGTFQVDLHQHALLLGAMLAVSWLVAALMARQRWQTAQARRLLRQAEQLRQLGDLLRDTDQPLAHAGALAGMLSELTQAPATLLMPRDAHMPVDAEAADLIGHADAEERAGLWHAWRQAQAMGPGTSRHQGLDAWYLPMRGRDGGRDAAFGAALLRWPDVVQPDAACRAHAQALCDQMGQALQRVRATQSERDAREQAQLQSVRNALLAAISHDYRTPLATILGAASSLQTQADRLSPDQRQRLATRIVEETGQLARLTDNTLQLARLDAPGVSLQLDWESAEDIVGTVLHRARLHAPVRALHARLEPHLPLLRCDALLINQLLDNLIDNALKHTPADTPIELVVRRLGDRQADRVVLAVRDRGAGVPPSWRERIFDAFQRDGFDDAGGAKGAARPGAGVGLAVCRAIARAHGGEMRLRARAHGGSSFELSLPVVPVPAMGGCSEAPQPSTSPAPGEAT
jgi:two-component system sensor histidine kinase KdpD